MAVVLVGVGADSGNVKPVPRIQEGRQFEYIPIPEKGTETTETRTFGSMVQRYGDGTLADIVDAVKPNGDADWVDDAESVRDHPVHYDPNLEALTYGEGGKDQNVNAIEDTLEEGDILAFYTGLETEGRMHRYIFGYFTLTDDPVIIEAEMSTERKVAILERHPENAHARRFDGNGELYAFDSEKPRGASRVVIVDGREPGGLLDRAVRLSAPGGSGNYYMTEEIEALLEPNTNYLGGFKPPIRCDIAATEFVEFVESRQ